MTPTIQNGHPEVPTHPLTADDQRILADMCSPDSETSFVFKHSLSPADILHNLYIATRATVMLDRKRDALIQVIGKILHVIKNNPEVYHSLGYKSFDFFLKKHVTEALGLGTTTLRTAMQIYEAFPSLQPADVAEVGVVKMKLLSKITNSTQPGHARMVEEAKTQTYSELLQVASVKANLPVGDILRTVVNIPCTKSQSHMWRQFIENPQVRAKCQTEDPGLIMEYMIAEVMAEWCSDPPA